MTIAIATGVVLLIGVGVAWACVRLLREVSRYEEWDTPVIKAKRKVWR